MERVTYILGTFCYPCLRAGQEIVWLLEYDSNLRPTGEQRWSTVVADLVALAKEPTGRLLNNGPMQAGIGDPNFGVVSYTSVGPRQCQLALKFRF